MNKYIIKLSEDYNYLINHVIVTSLVEKGTTEYKCKSYKTSQREMVIITDKTLSESIYTHNYPNRVLKYKVVKTEYNPIEHEVGQIVTLYGLVSYSFVPWGTKKSICPVDIRTNQIIHKDKLLYFLSQNLGLKDIKVCSVQGESKSELPDGMIIYDKFFIEIEGTISDLDKFNNSIHCSIGKKKSYGLGAFLIK